MKKHQIGFGPRIRKSPFFKAVQDAGVTHYSIYNKMYFPLSFGDPKAEYERLVNGVAMWDVAVERQVKITGPDALELVKTLTPRNLDTVTVGQGRYVPVCDHRGVLINDPVLLPISEGEYWLSIADSDLLLWARAIAYERKLTVDISEPDVSPLAVQGPKSADVVASLFGDWIRELKYFGFRTTTLDGMDLIVARSGWSKQGGFEIYLKNSKQGTKLWDAVAEAGKPFDIGPGAPNYIERVESGLLSVGADTDDMTDPFEVRLGKLVDCNQPRDFIGKQALQMIAARGPRRMQCGFFISGKPFPGPNQHKWPVMINGIEVGFISAASYSPRVRGGSNIGLGLVLSELAQPGAKMQAETEHGIRNIEVTDLPFDTSGA